MVYKINNEIIFDNNKGLVWSVNESDRKISLTQTTNRLLVYLIDKKGVAASREEILTYVWEAHGLKTSTNSLNKYISDLRGIIKDMGCLDEVILTVPRFGFMISEQTKIESVLVEVSQTGIPNKKGIKFLYFSVCVLLSILIFIFISTGKKIKNVFNVESFIQGGYYIGKVGSCKVYTLGKSTLETSQLKMSKAKEILEYRELTCSTDEVIYIQTSNSIQHNAVGRVFFSICRVNSEHFTSCYNYYEIFYE